MIIRTLLLLLTAALGAAQVRPVRLEELPAELQQKGWLEEIAQATSQRVRDGEWLLARRHSGLITIANARASVRVSEADACSPDIMKRLQNLAPALVMRCYTG